MWKRLLTLGMLLSLTACGTLSSTPVSPTPTQGISTAYPKVACLVWKTITFDRLKDTTETILEVKAGNVAREAYCGA